jgi:hypothetical protein
LRATIRLTIDMIQLSYDPPYAKINMTESFDKLAVLRSQLDSAIFLVSLDDGFVAAHTIIMAAEEIFRTLYVKKDLFVEFDYRFYIKDEHQIEYLQKMREKYNFFKHADRDIDAILEVDREQIHKLNEILLGTMIAGYRKVFSKSTDAMDAYGKWFAAAHPNYIKWEQISGGEQIKIKLQKLDPDIALRRQMLRVLLYHSGVLPKDDFDFLRIMAKSF